MVQNIDQSNVLGRVRGSRDEEQRERTARVRVRYVQSNPQSNFTAPVEVFVKCHRAYSYPQLNPFSNLKSLFIGNDF